MTRRSSYRHVPTRITPYTNKCCSELCRNCVRSPRNPRQTPTFMSSHRGAFGGGNSLNRLREEVLQYHFVSVSGFAFQACSFNRRPPARARPGTTRAIGARGNSGPFSRVCPNVFSCTRGIGNVCR